MRPVNIIALVVVFIMIFTCAYYIDEVSTARWSSFFNDFDYGYGYGSYYGGNADELTMQAGLITLLFILFFTFGYIGNLVKVKTTTSKVMSIIGLSLTFIALLVNFVTLADPGGASFDETGGVFIFYGIINLAFFIVLLVQSVQYFNRQNKVVTPAPQNTPRATTTVDAVDPLDVEIE